MDRTTRIAEEMKKEISEIIRSELKDPRIPKMISVTNVDLTKDLSLAKIYVSIYGKKEEKEEAIIALKKASGFVRREIAQRIKIRYIPEMKFILDDSIEKGFYLTDLIDRTMKKD
ncbi:MAG: 30S ribosome-binding factor RbfA [Clostridiales bacterium]